MLSNEFSAVYFEAASIFFSLSFHMIQLVIILFFFCLFNFRFAFPVPEEHGRQRGICNGWILVGILIQGS